MGFLDNFRRANNQTLTSSWKTLDNILQLEEIIKDSAQKPVILFKHSISCGISAAAKHRLESQWSFEESEVDFYYLDLINHRAVSNEIASKFGVVHQSPQIIVIKNGKAVFNNSHHAISISAIREAL